MSNTFLLALPLLLLLVAATQWLLAQAKNRLSIEDKARLTDATFQRWWPTVILAALIGAMSFAMQSLPRQWQWRLSWDARFAIGRLQHVNPGTLPLGKGATFIKE